MELIIESTADGSPTLYRKDIEEHYHSVKGALAESRHVYVDSGWKAASSVAAHPIRVFEVGFGSGLNAVLTADAAFASDSETVYYSVERFPLPAETAKIMADNFSGHLTPLLNKVNEAQWDCPVEINPHFTLVKMQADLLSMEIPDNINVVYFDAFAPEKQPEMWTEDIFRRIFRAMSPQGVLTTYCAKGAVRRMLQEIGFRCERLPGPPAGKREILRAVKP